jgi:hypothetical protein
MPPRRNVILRPLFLWPLLANVLYVLLLLGTFTPAQADDGTLTVSIVSQVAFSSQNGCGGGCIYNTGTDAADAAINIQYHCSSNGCYCATQSQSLYSSFITSCWSYACYNLVLGDPSSTIPRDVSFALSVYNGYCATALPQKAATTTSNGPTSTTTTSTITPPSHSTAIPTATTTTVTSNTAVAKSGLSPGAIGGIAGGIAAALIAGILIGVIFISRLRKRQQSGSVQNIASPQGVPQHTFERPHEKAELPAFPNEVSGFGQNYNVR